MEEKLVDISIDSSLISRFQSQFLSFRCGIEDEYPVISKKALRTMIPFASSYIYDYSVSSVAVVKSKLNIEK